MKDADQKKRGHQKISKDFQLRSADDTLSLNINLQAVYETGHGRIAGTGKD